MSDTTRRPVAAVAAFLWLLALSGCATLGHPPRVVDRICASGELETGVTAIEAVIAALETVRAAKGEAAPGWLAETEAGLRTDLAYLRAGCQR